jgi:hypothetical protein
MAVAGAEGCRPRPALPWLQRPFHRAVAHPVPPHAVASSARTPSASGCIDCLPMDLSSKRSLPKLQAMAPMEVMKQKIMRLTQEGKMRAPEGRRQHSSEASRTHAIGGRPELTRFPVQPRAPRPFLVCSPESMLPAPQASCARRRPEPTFPTPPSHRRS